MRMTADDKGFTLIEVLIGVAVTVVSVFGLVQLFTLAARANVVSHQSTFAAALASEKLEQLLGLSWGFDSVGNPTADTTTDVALSPERPGGAGLTPSPAGTLTSNVSGYCDFLDGRGRSLGTGTSPPVGALYVRRWSLELLPGSGHALLLQVRVTGRTSAWSGLGRAPAEVRLLAVRTRKSPRSIPWPTALPPSARSFRSPTASSRMRASSTPSAISACAIRPIPGAI